ncbi:PREDICTED: probable protein phosphatase 2C 50 isoform X1 [Ipomoea nil]|uniref:probable protein phosphatase 2C 50 isoform X1 n=1 Tax=Ipomoea nil TaxID=35883 RepID=UPI0009018467|nr:PREDICTED: probable protein phosphatase 2C 50 isoform X1 [Ipomoea nil]
MEEGSPTIAVHYKPGNRVIYDESGLPSRTNISGLELVAYTTKLSLVSIGNGSMMCDNRRVPRDRFDDTRGYDNDEIRGGGEMLLSKVRGNGICLVISDAKIGQNSRDNGLMSPTSGKLAGSISSCSERNGSSFVSEKECEGAIEANSGATSPNNGAVLSINKSYSVNGGKQCIGFDSTPPLWGLVSIRGKRMEMEDSAVALPRFSGIPSRMQIHVPDTNAMARNPLAHFYGVFDGHGGCQVANYCRERFHLALTEELHTREEDLHIESNGSNWKEQWEKALFSCFRKVDDEVGGISRSDNGFESGVVDPIAPEAVGSTAVVSIVCPTHIIVANCGDSRAVLCRGKSPVPLSIDHKPNREDEYSRIEALGGKVINWDGHRVSGVLAVSRSIGDRYLRPYVIPEPEMTFTPRAKEDECLILASDGLWDVMGNEEVCDVARRRILLWHKKNGGTPSKERGDAAPSKERGDAAASDPAAQDAAQYLTRIALQRGSQDNISVIVVDLKAQRKFKKKV